MLATAVALGGWRGLAPARVTDAAAVAPSLRDTRPVARLPSLADGYHRALDLRGFVDLHRDRLHEPETAYYVSQALEECAALRTMVRDGPAPGPRWAAASALTVPCHGFEDGAIAPGEIVALLSSAATGGEPHAIARMLLFRDIAAPKSEVLGAIPMLLATRDPAVVRDVGAFLSRGEIVWRYGLDEVPVVTAAVAWELVACDLGYACGPASRLVLAQCAFFGRCDAASYEDAVLRYEGVELMAQAQRLRTGMLRALRDHDWAWLGLIDQ